MRGQVIQCIDGPDDRSLNSRNGEIFFLLLSVLSNAYLRLSAGVNWPGRESTHTPTSNVEDKNVILLTYLNTGTSSQFPYPLYRMY